MSGHTHMGSFPYMVRAMPGNVLYKVMSTDSYLHNIYRFETAGYN